MSLEALADRALIGRDLGNFTPSAPNLLGVIRALVNSFRIDQYIAGLDPEYAALSGLLRIEHCKTGHLGGGVLFDHALQQCCRGYLTQGSSALIRSIDAITTFCSFWGNGARTPEQRPLSAVTWAPASTADHDPSVSCFGKTR